MVCREWDVAADALLGMAGLPGVLAGGSSMTSSPDCAIVTGYLNLLWDNKDNFIFGL